MFEIFILRTDALAENWNSNVNNVTWVCPYVSGGLLLRTDIIPFCTIPNVVLRINSIFTLKCSML
jgi:hypothetical protein